MTTFPALRLSHSYRDGVLTVAVEGPLEYGTTDDFTDHVEDALAAHPATHTVRLACAGISYVDSMGVSALLMLGRRMRAAGTRLCMNERPAQLSRVLEITGILDYLLAGDQPAETAAPPDRDAADGSSYQDEALSDPARPT
ncbi:STAS domain-containing protein [Streptomyces sp. cg35]|uniref:STAS domain-containing protein n=1 Tax=Streptomyces sp. cg35 TaxID=3421650 RepID=UPI003D16AA0C